MDNLGDFFSLIGEEKKKETDRVKRELYEKEKQLDEIKKEHKVLKNLFCDETPKPIKTDDWREDYSPIEIESYDIIKPEPLKPSPGAEKYEISESVEKWKNSLDILKEKENWITENLEQQDTVQAQIDLLRKQLAQTQAKVEVQGGGGATWLWDLDDVNIGYPGSTGYPPITDGSLLIYDDSSDRWVGIASTSLTPGDTDLQHVLETDNIAGLGMSVGFITATGMNVSGNVTIGGTLTYEDVKNVDAIGIITARKGIVSLGIVTALGFDGNVTAGVVTATDGLFVGVVTATSLVVGTTTDHTLSVTGKVDSNLIPAQNQVYNLGNIDHKWNNVYGNVVHSTLLTTNKVSASSSVTATSFYGDGAGLINVGVDTANVSTNTLNVLGVSTFSGDVTINGDLNVSGTTQKSSLAVVNAEVTGVATIKTNEVTNSTVTNLNVTGVSTLGIVTGATSVQATKFYGDGSGLTGLANTNRITAESLVVLGVTTSFGGIVVDRTSVPNNILTAKLNGVTKAQIVANGNAQFSSLTSPGTLNVAGVSTLTTVNATSFIGPLTGSSTLVGGVSSTFLLNYDNFTNTPTNLNQFVNGPGYVTNNVTGDFAVSGNLSIGGTLTYEDVQNVDSIGIVTAGKGVRVTSGGLVVSGVSTLGVVNATSFSGDGSGLTGIANTANVSTNTLVVTGVSTLGTVNATSFSGGKVSISSGIVTAVVPTTEANLWAGVTYGNGKYVAVSGDGTNQVMYSTNGIDWTSASAAENNNWESVTYGNSKFVAVSKNGTNRVMYSTNGINWTSTSAAENNNWESVIYGNGKFVAVSSNGTNQVMYSTNGINWTSASAAAAVQWRAVTYGNGKFVAICSYSGATQSNQVMYSTDGINWTSASSASHEDWQTITYGNGKYVALRDSFSGDQVMYSTDAINWTSSAAPGSGNWLGVIYGTSKFVAVSSTGIVIYSTDAINWSLGTATEPNAWTAVTYGNGKFVAVSATGTNRVMYSTNGINWLNYLPVSYYGDATLGTLSVNDNLTLDNVAISSIQTSGETFVDNDTTLMTAAAIKDLIPTTFSGTQGHILQYTGSGFVGVSSVGIATFINDYHQGYYRYSTNYYTTGVANTVQNLPSDDFVLIQPSVRTNKTEYMPQKMLVANGGDPWVGTGATIGTGQTTFSLAGLDEGSSVIVRIASQFDPDVDNTNLDFKIQFTTNPTTQGSGVTNFSIIREQGLICNEGADQPYISETLVNFYVGSSLAGLTTADAGTFSLYARASEEGEFEMMSLTINVVA